jgi:hypothetical protein
MTLGSSTPAHCSCCFFLYSQLFFSYVPDHRFFPSALSVFSTSLSFSIKISLSFYFVPSPTVQFLLFDLFMVSFAYFLIKIFPLPWTLLFIHYAHPYVNLLYVIYTY